MGSHGGATIDGQLRILKDFGITEELMGCPIKATMEVVEIAKSEFNNPVYTDKYALTADKIIIVNKIKTHSKFVGPIESGLSKMALIGLGKSKGAKLYHRLIDRHSWPIIANSLCKLILEKLPIIGGLAVIQNAYNEIAQIHMIKPSEFNTKEPFFLKKYKELQPGIPFRELDLLIIDEMGKNVFGTGMDTRIIGRKIDSEMKVQWVFVRDLTSETHGNAQGIGLADFTTDHLLQKINYSKMYENALSAYRTDSAKIPIHFPTDKDVLKKIFELADIQNPSELKIVWIKNTLELKKIIISQPFFEKVKEDDNLKSVSNIETITFDKTGFLKNSKKFW
jgi:hypothetical protein